MLEGGSLCAINRLGLHGRVVCVEGSVRLVARVGWMTVLLQAWGSLRLPLMLEKESHT